METRNPDKEKFTNSSDKHMKREKFYKLAGGLSHHPLYLFISFSMVPTNSHPVSESQVEVEVEVYIRGSVVIFSINYRL